MTVERYIGIDVHKRHVTIAAVNIHQQPVLAPQKILVTHFAVWAQRHLLATDHIALEATANAWTFHDLLQSIVADVSVANPYKVQMIASSTRKTDKHDAVVLAKLLAAKLLPAVWVPPPAVRELRSLTTHRMQLIGQCTAAKNRLHALLHQHNLSLPAGPTFGTAQKAWWTTLPLARVERLQIQHEWHLIDCLNTQIAETEAEIAQLSVTAPCNEAMTFLMQLPGVGLYTGRTILAAIGEVTRFPSPQHLVGYAGLGARVHASGDIYRTGKITKQGRRELRTALIACAWSAVPWSAYWRSSFQRLAQRIGRTKAITAVARKLLVVIWHVLTNREVDRHADPEAVARSFMTWASHHHLARTMAVHRLDFVRERLTRLGLLHQVSSFRANGRAHYLTVPT